jgi:hypothetical protein
MTAPPTTHPSNYSNNCWWHNPGLRQRWLHVPRKGWPTGGLMQSQQPGTQHSQNHKDGNRRIGNVPLEVNGLAASTAESFKVLGTIGSNNLKWDDNITAVTKKHYQRCSTYVSWRESNSLQLPPPRENCNALSGLQRRSLTLALHRGLARLQDK